MASSSKQNIALEEQYAQIKIDAEEEGILIEGGSDGDEMVLDDRWCLVGKFLTGRSIDFDAMRHLMTSHLGTRQRNGSSWTFNRFPLVFHRLKRGENPKAVHLHKMNMWVQIHDLITCFMLEKVVRSAGSYMGTFVKSDPKNFNGI
ncbi:hypothetical protein F8388_024098 [Cannabis sativa]|uniref:DUF4283 domain-containing protein n=1 Tax=Cannabis sativa TaxID=3483 RepID=A0A7J6G0A3_CANSA|nr:hypothetical protein F8388_024098 [Cannabis sativa]KAF4383444.1 hypothetical protein G4B88_024018 [Cannabis sativa]